MCAFDWHLFLEYLKVLVSWPVIALLIVLFFVTPLKGLINRIRGAKLFGQDIVVGPQEQEKTPKGEKDILMKAAEEATVLETPAAGTTEPLPIELQDDPHAKTAIAWVTKNPVQTVIEYKKLTNRFGFERLYNQIYGTQILLLDYLLSSAPGNTATLTQISSFYWLYLAKPGAITTYAQQNYMSFLVGFNVLTETTTPQGNTYTLTKLGTEFLEYIKANYPHVWNQKAF